jgi:putrescine importer
VTALNIPAFISVATSVSTLYLALFCSIIFIIAIVAGGIVGQAGASRLLYGMGRDRVIPGKIFAYLHPKYKTPTFNILIMFVISVVGAMILDLGFASELVCFGAFIGFMFLNISVISHYFIKKKERSGVGTLTNLIFPLLGFGFCFYIWINMSIPSKMVGVTWFVLGIIYAAITTKGFRKLCF